MKKRSIGIAAGLLSIMVLAGCQNTAGNSETAALKEQIAQLEQQVTELEKQGGATGSTGNTNSTDGTAAAAGNEAPAQEPAQTPVQEPAADSQADAGNQADAAAAAEQPASQPVQDNTQTAAQGSYTLAELRTMVDEFVTKANAAQPSGAEKDRMSQFFTLKGEADQIDYHLERYEDDLEYQYNRGGLTRDEFRSQDRELELIESDLDRAEDGLEYVFGIDD